MRIDHILIFVSEDGSEVSEFESMGLMSGRKVSHPGQGTSNTCFAFDNCYLELLWCSDSAEINSPVIRPTGMWQRSRWWETNACPFGLALRCTDLDEQPAFRTIEYRPPYLPGSLAPIRIGADSGNASEPFLIVMPDVMPSLKSEAHQLQTGLGLKQITAVEMVLPFDYRRSKTLVAVAQNDLVTFQRGDCHHLILEIDNRRRGQQQAFRHPHLPVTLLL